MEKSSKFFGLVGVLKESLNILRRSVKLMSSIVLISFLLNIFLFLSKTFSSKPWESDLNAKALLLSNTTPNSSEQNNLVWEFQESGAILMGIKLVFFLVGFLISLFSIAATVLASATAFCKKNPTSKNLISRAFRSWIKLLIIYFYTTLFTLGYVLSVLVVSFPLLLAAYRWLTIKPVSIVITVLALIFWLHLSVVWVLAVVVSVVEENCSGIAAIEKARGLVKDERLNGFLLNLFTTLLLAIIEILQYFVPIRSTIGTLFMDLFFTNLSCLATLFTYILFSVLYFRCKKCHGEEIELRGNIEYTKLPTTLLVDEDV